MAIAISQLDTTLTATPARARPATPPARPAPATAPPWRGRASCRRWRCVAPAHSPALTREDERAAPRRRRGKWTSAAVTTVLAHRPRKTALDPAHRQRQLRGGERGGDRRTQRQPAPTARRERQHAGERGEQQRGRDDAAPHRTSAVHRNHAPATITSPPRPRTTAAPPGRSAIRPMPMPATWSIPVARTKPAL